MKVLKFYSETCGPCKILEKNLQLAGIPHESIDAQSMENEDIIAKYNIMAVPTLILINDKDEVIKRHRGLLSVQELKEFYNNINNS